MKAVNQKPFEKIKTLDDALKSLSMKKVKYGKVGRPKKDIKAYKCLAIITRAINKHANLSVKYVPYKGYDKKPFKFDDLNYLVPSTMFYATEKRANHAIANFSELFAELYSI